jgi:imidazoleglycerol-phosphate dehydratase
MRRATIARKTAETEISVEINLDGTGAYDNRTGVGFFDHMLDQLARHALIDLTVKATGDLHIDDHHTVEDVGITLGQALAEGARRQARDPPLRRLHAGDGRGARRRRARPFGTALPRLGRRLPHAQDRHLRHRAGARVLPGAVDPWRHHAARHETGGVNSHHIAEAAFKAVARALREAVEPDPRRSDAIPSTKGAL